MKKRENGFVGVLTCIVMLFVVLILFFVFVTIINQIKNEEEYGVKQGEVVDKKYSSGYYSYVYTGKISIPTYHPASYRICIQKNINGELKSIWIDVDSDTYRELNIGEYYNREEE